MKSSFVTLAFVDCEGSMDHELAPPTLLKRFLMIRMIFMIIFTRTGDRVLKPWIAMMMEIKPTPPTDPGPSQCTYLQCGKQVLLTK